MAYVRDLDADLLDKKIARLDEIRRACIWHAMWCAFQIAVGQPYNEEPTESQLASLMDGLRAYRENPDMTPEQNHQNWIDYKIAQGWRYGLVKDERQKTHPDLVPFDRLPDIEAAKDIMDLMARRFAFALFPE